MKKIKVLVVDDSALMRKIISDMINSEMNMEAIGTARNGQDLFFKLEKFTPDVITLDVQMPIMDGISALKEMKRKNINVPVIVLSSMTKKSSELTMECLENGAFDFIPKPSGTISLDINKVKDDLITKINLAYEKCEGGCKEKDIRKNAIESINNQELIVKENKDVNINSKLKKNSSNKIEAVVIGASTGGPKALYSVITKLPKNINIPIFIVQHMPATFTKAFADRLNNNSNIKVVEAKEGDVIEKNVAYVAPGGFHMEIGLDKKIHLNTEPSIWGVRPAVDKLFISASKVYKDRLLSVVLTGMGRDGADGTDIIKDKGGITISEDKSTCTIYGMPKATFETGKVDMVLPLHVIGEEITRIVKESWR
ncbi:two-component system chemotaxis response regulator CheB [Clostridium tetanomorphum]|uniref:protein-glutamate methylesterase/protein-glutamine glutaminase n=1 Tax=Clostridium tetanomorphum TaxID=1553 RepID=UPI000445F121|nr:chemotaxis response regulator protein-glutamate methylesterase [Clostridium tetanomorphum]KAJ53488.1 chemotaxis response regulator protein-glutamate methylesterase [Clostridium tetanomorphum DSM 665]MBP1865279.1 two-component system chemotaxis response regulator CheB [Clostridium tetanomorphum]NRS85202.1 two-component system chemotaxis response regulator CheB [Clostridium tetanomorphum]SQC03089.1 chemotaxis response regulator protein-glutamate methylesterase [Clostridium tetanomorphum]